MVLADYDVSEKQIKGSIRHDYITEKGDTLKAIPIVRGYVECTIGSDSLKTRIKEIYFDNYYKYNEYEYLNLWIDAYLLYDGELNIKEVRMTVPRREKYEIEKFRLDICNDLAEFLKKTRWIKKEGFPEPVHTASYQLDSGILPDIYTKIYSLINLWGGVKSET